MSKERIQQLLVDLRKEVNATNVDDTTKAKLDELCSTFDAGQSAGEVNEAIKKAEELEVEFAVRHPVAENCLREIIDMLAKMGV